MHFSLIFLKGEVIGLGKKSIVVKITAHREKLGVNGQDFVGEGEFVFISIDNKNIVDKPDLLPYCNHGLKMSTFGEIFKGKDN